MTAKKIFIRIIIIATCVYFLYAMLAITKYVSLYFSGMLLP